MGQIVKAKFISLTGKEVIVMQKHFLTTGSFAIIVPSMLEDLNKRAPITDKFSYIKGSYSSNVTRKEWMDYLKDR